jgi:AP-3 complex subunit beta
VKLQTLTLAAKLLALAPENDIIGKMVLYCFNLARYDDNYDLRDRARMLQTLLSDICPLLKTGSSQSAYNEDAEESTHTPGTITLRKEQIQLILLQGKEASKEEPDPIGKRLLRVLID